MFKRSRIRIVASTMAVLILFMAVVFTSLYLTSYFETENRNNELLGQYVGRFNTRFDREEKPDDMDSKDDSDDEKKPFDDRERKRPPNDEYSASTFYSVTFSDSGDVLEVNNGGDEYQSEDELVSTAREILSSGSTDGNTGNLKYKVDKRNGYTLVAFINTAVTSSSMNIMLRNLLITGGAAIVILFFISVFVAGKILKPLEKEDELQRQFISDAGHELKTPIAVISTNIELLDREAGDSEWLSNIRYENERMGTLVRQLLDLSRVSDAKVISEQIDFSRLVEGEELPFESVAFEKGLSIENDIQPDISIEGNRTQLCQLVSILLDNAIRHSTGGVIDLSLKKERHNIVLSVTNNGDPIPDDRLDKLFERFYRVDTVRNSESGHYGLGLAIAKSIVEKHKGSIKASCADGKVTFTVKLAG